MVATNVTKCKVSKIHNLSNTDESNKSPRKTPQLSKLPFTLIVAIIGILGCVMVLGLYVCHIRMEMVRMASLIQENQMEIRELHSQLERYQDTTYNGISPAVNKIIQEQVQKSEKGRYKRDSNDDMFIGVHLAGATGRNSRRPHIQDPQPQKYFYWAAYPDHRTISQMEIIHDSEIGSYVVINTDGYYFVYSQVTYSGFGDFEIGHSTVRVNDESSDILMTTVNSQQLASAKSGRFNRRRSQDSGYHSGVFYFYAGEKVAVKPFNHLRKHEYSTDDTNSFFGLYLIHQ